MRQQCCHILQPVHCMVVCVSMSPACVSMLSSYHVLVIATIHMQSAISLSDYCVVGTCFGDHFFDTFHPL